MSQDKQTHMTLSMPSDQTDFEEGDTVTVNVNDTSRAWEQWDYIGWLPSSETFSSENSLHDRVTLDSRKATGNYIFIMPDEDVTVYAYCVGKHLT